MELKEALAELRKDEKRKFEQSVDLIVNLKGVDLKRTSVSSVISVPHKIKEKKVCGFLSKKSPLINSITKPEFDKYKDKKALKNLIKNYDFFISIAGLMPSVATTFGKILGPAGKMPSPQLGVISNDDDKSINDILNKISKSVKIRANEPSIKLSVGRENMKDEEIADNIRAIYNGVINMLPAKKDNVRSVLVKFSMSKPIKLEIK